MRPLIDLPPELRSIVEDELEAGEAVQWYAQPRGRRFLLPALVLVLFGIPWTGFAVFWTVAVAGFARFLGEGPPPIFACFGIPFVLIGIGLLSSPFWMLRKARRIVYIITDRRAILFEGGRSMTVRSFGPEHLGDLIRRQRPDGSGDIIFESRTWRDSDGDRRTSEAGFYGIEDVKAVEDMLTSLSHLERQDQR